MTILHTLSGQALVGPLTEELGKVRSLFERGPDTPLNYAAEFGCEYAQARQQAIGQPVHSTQPGGPSL